MTKKLKFGLESQGYAAPRAESVAIAQESILCASLLNGATTTNYRVVEDVLRW